MVADGCRWASRLEIPKKIGPFSSRPRIDPGRPARSSSRAKRGSHGDRKRWASIRRDSISSPKHWAAAAV